MRRTKWGLAAAVVACMVGFGGTARTAQAGLVTALSLTDANSGNSPTSGDYLAQGSVVWDIITACSQANCGSLYATLGGNGIVISGSGSNSITSVVAGGDFSVTFEEYTTSGKFGSAAFSSIGGSGTGSAEITDTYLTPINNNDANLSTVGSAGTNFPSTITITNPASDIFFAVDVKNNFGTLQSVSIGQPVPEPGAIGLLGFGLAALVSVGLRGRRRQSAL